ncbi:MAG TPA: DUF3368 domain-containing protein [Leptospiraceae bacterium]|nr:DUF3368 domain-containing protein [Leptospiraceae bacterium]HMW06708.1 DUF3368 domain-containing protein [Leptospiraceae bacterium]HMX34631.1 DUF3368 domain-containing protein [Leptospiraceae bacterium]HMY32014.1 DUF3368 domain-containing protein [Leptospiraceae bacterium]HMZ66251.1 DUF3368 domain-containing protein [Leptospiraceae bacterium]
MIVVSDTSPISNLIVIGNLNILITLFQDIYIPPKVFAEILRLEEFNINVSEIKNSNSIKIKSASNAQLIQDLKETLNEGESEAIALAKELEADYILIDERKGRKIAEQMGIKSIGLLGILLKAKEKRVFERIAPILNALREEAGFWISDILYHDILMQANEI